MLYLQSPGARPEDGPSCLFSVNDEAIGSAPLFGGKEAAGTRAGPGDVFSFKTRIGEEDDEELDVNVKACWVASESEKKRFHPCRFLESIDNI